MPDAREASPENPPPAQPAPAARRGSVVLALAAGFVLLVYAWIASSDLWQMGAAKPEKAYYNLLIEGFRAGQLNLKTTVPPELARLPDPYDPVANEPYRLHDASYYKGKIYLYFGVTPALVLFWPYAALTGHYLSHQQAVMIFSAVGFLAGAALVIAVWRRYFPGASVAMAAVAVLAAGLVNTVPVLLGRADVWEVPISCGYAFGMLALGALWRAWHAATQRVRWLALASLAYGLAVGARPSMLPGAVILLLPIVSAWRAADSREALGGRDAIRLWFAAMAPITAIGIGLLIFNYLRFDSPWEFGQRYQLAGVKVSTQRLFGLDYFWTNVRLYFFEPLRWTADFPYAQGIKVPPAPPGHLGAEGAFGALINLPFLWLAVAAGLAWRAGAGPLRGLLIAVALLFGISATILCTFAGACDRYEVEFLPALTLLAGIGGLAWETAAGPGHRRNVVRGTAILVLVISAATNWLASFKSSPEALTVAGNELASAGAQKPAIEKYLQALRVEPDLPQAHHGLGVALATEGRLPEAVEHFRAALRTKPNFAEAHNALGVTLQRLQQPAAALAEFESALRISPRYAEAHFDCGVVLVQLNRPAEAVPHFEEVLRLKPDFPGARARLESARRAAGSAR